MERETGGLGIGVWERVVCPFFWVCKIREKATSEAEARSGNIIPGCFLINKIQAHTEFASVLLCCFDPTGGRVSNDRICVNGVWSVAFHSNTSLSSGLSDAPSV